MAVIAPLVNATAAACWMHDRRQSVARLAEYNFDGLGLQDDQRAAHANHRLLAQTIRRRAPQVQPIQITSDPAISHVVTLPVTQGDDCIGALEFFAFGTIWQMTPDDVHDLNSVSQIMSQFLKDYEETLRATDPRQFLEEFETFTRDCHSSLDPWTVATNVANDSVALLNCDRVSVLVKRGSRFSTIAISGRNRVNRRANQIRLLQDLAQQSVRLQEVLTWSGGDVELSPAMTETLAAYVAESQAKMIRIHRLTRPAPESSPDDTEESRHAAQRRIIGALVLEQFSDNTPHPVLAAYSQKISDQAATAMTNALAYRRLPLLRLFDAAGHGLQWLSGRRAATAAAVILLVAACVLGMLTVPAIYRVEARGKLMPVIQRRVFAPDAGEIAELLVVPGDVVAAGTPLILIRNEDLDAEQLLLRNQQNSTRTELHSLTAELHNASGLQDRAQILRLQADVEAARIELKSLETRIARVGRQIDRLTLRAPVDGTVVTFVSEQQLLGRPVTRGDILLEVMDESGPWRLELEVPENRMQHLRTGQLEHPDGIPSSFRLASAPAKSYSGQLTYVSDHAKVNSTNQSVVEVRVGQIDAPELKPTIGSDVVAKLHCTEYSLLYVVFGDVVEFSQRHLWF